jgi:predicted amidohydrolase YtcJ
MTAVFTNLTMWTGAQPQTEDGHLVVRDGRVIAVCAGRYRGGALHVDEVIDLEGGCLLPAFGDGHAHPVFGALEQEGPRISDAQTVDEVVEIVAGYAREHPEERWIVGGSYSPVLTPDGIFDAAWLDRAVADRPVILRAHDYHTVWCNTEALRRAGITEATPDPPLGRIVRRPDGTPRGTLREWGACDLVLDLVPERTPATLRHAVMEASATCASVGLTWVLDAWVDTDSGLVDAYLDAAGSGALRTRFDLALRADPQQWRDQRQVFAQERRRVSASGSGELIRARTVKFFADGIIENGTALMLEGYCDCPLDHGMAVWEPAELREAVAAFDADGFQVHVHAIGDAGVRMALDAIEHAVRANRAWDRRPVISHLQLISDQDLPRFAANGIIANFEPYWAQNDDVQELLTIPRLGERSTGQYPMATVLDTGARLSFGSDWPVSSLNPLEGLRVAVTRAGGGESADEGLPGKRMTLPQALRVYTAGAAYQAGAEELRGVIAPGMTADLVWIAEDPFRVTAKNLSAVPILGTWLAGKRTH